MVFAIVGCLHPVLAIEAQDLSSWWGLVSMFAGLLCGSDVNSFFRNAEKNCFLDLCRSCNLYN